MIDEGDSGSLIVDEEDSVSLIVDEGESCSLVIVDQEDSVSLIVDEGKSGSLVVDQEDSGTAISGAPGPKLSKVPLVEVPKAQVKRHICTSFLEGPEHAHPENF